MIKSLLQISLSLLLILSCNSGKQNQKLTETIKMYPNDPFKSTMVKSQFFDINANQDNVIEGQKGTIIIIPKGCFQDENGDIVEKDVKIELAEALTMNNILLSNLNTTSDGKPLETDGMIYFNATSNGKPLAINKENPIHIEIPTSRKKPDMMVYKGTRDEKGNMNWSEPQAINNYLTTIELKSLDFLPSGFQDFVERNMPFKHYKVATQELVDSLYYSFSNNSSNYRIFRKYAQRRWNAGYNEPYYNKNSQVEDGEYTPESYNQHEENDGGYKLDTAKTKNCGIDPAIIKVIKSEKYQNTLIATREFETRLKVIFRTCKDEILEVYIKNLDKNLYELDKLAADLISNGDEFGKSEFENFAKQRLTKVKDADKYALLLKEYYQTQLKKVKLELEQNSEKFKHALEKDNEENEKLLKEYKQLLFKRETYRMETYGFEWSKTGWINVDNGTLPKTWDEQPLEVVISNGKKFDRAYTYIIYESIKSLFRLNTDDNELFYVGNNEDKRMIMPKQAKAIIISIGYKDEKPSLVIQEFQTGSKAKMTISLNASTLEKVEKTIGQYSYSKENQIGEDLKYMAAFYKAEKKRKAYQGELDFLYRLLRFVEPCCFIAAE
jgi:hypothetical protein